MTDRNRAWRRKQARKVLAKINETKTWLLKTIQKRTGEKPMPVAGAKPKTQGKLTRVQFLKLEEGLLQESFDANAA